MDGVERRGAERPRTASGFRMLVALVVGAGAVAGGCGGSDSKSAPTHTPTVSPTPAPTQIAGAGLKSDILGAAVASEPAGSVSVTFTVTDEGGIPLTATTSSAESDQQARVRFALARLEEYAGGGDLGNTFFRYVNEVNETSPAYDSGGTLEVVDAAAGTYRYTFATHLPAGYDPNADPGDRHPGRSGLRRADLWRESGVRLRPRRRHADGAIRHDHGAVQ